MHSIRRPCCWVFRSTATRPAPSAPAASNQSTYDNAAVRLVAGDTPPDQDTICAFRRENQALVTESFVKILALAQELKLAKFGQVTVSIDGTKILASASKHAAVIPGPSRAIVRSAAALCVA